MHLKKIRLVTYIKHTKGGCGYCRALPRAKEWIHNTRVLLTSEENIQPQSTELQTLQKLTKQSKEPTKHK